MNKKEGSLSRSKKTTLSITEVLAKEGVSNLVPGGALLYKGAKILLEHGRQYVKDRTEERLCSFYSVLVEGQKNEEDISKILEGKFEVSDYHAILSSCMQDIEDEKTEVYANLFKNIIIKSISSEKRKLFIQAVKNLSMFDLDYIKNMYIQGTYDLMTTGGATHQLKELLNTKDAMKNISLLRFVSLGLVDEKKSKLTELGKSLVEYSFEENELLPEAIGRKSWTGIKIAIICFEINNEDHSRFYTAFDKELWSRQIKSNVHILDSKQQSMTIFDSGGLLFVGDKKISDNYLEGVVEFSKLRPLVRVDITSKGDFQLLENVQIMERYSLVDCAKGDEESAIEKIVSKIFTE